MENYAEWQLGPIRAQVAIGANQSQVVRISMPCTIMQNTTSMTHSLLCLKLVAGPIIAKFINYSIRIVSSRAREDSQHPLRLLFPTHYQ